MILKTEVLRIGTLCRTHGTKGEIQCQMENMYWDEADAEFLIVETDGILVPFRVDDWRGKGADTLLFHLSGVDDEKKAARLCGSIAYMLRRDLSEDTEIQPSWQELIGYIIEDESQGRVGIVHAVDESTVNTLLETEEGRLFPIHKDLIRHIDTANRTLSVCLPKGL